MYFVLLSKAPSSPLFQSSFNLDAFKRVYSNEDTATKAVPYFWENFDKEGWSIWKADYNFNADLKFIFMSSNLVSGMFQRLDKMRKYAFASVLILGEDNNNSISGIWVMRGQQLAFEVCGGGGMVWGGEGVRCSWALRCVVEVGWPGAGAIIW